MNPDHEQTTSDPHARRERHLWSLWATSFVFTACCWLLAISQSLASSSPILVVGIPAQAVAGSSLPVRVVAIDQEQMKKLSGRFTFAIFRPPASGTSFLREGMMNNGMMNNGLSNSGLANDAVAADANVSSVSVLPTNLLAPSEPGPWLLEIVGPSTTGAAPHVVVPLEVVANLPPRSDLFTFRSWRKTIIRGEGPPLYPVLGDVPATQRTEAVVLEIPESRSPTPDRPTERTSPGTGKALVRIVALQGDPARTQDEWKRSLRVERQDLKLEGPLIVEPGHEFSVSISPPDEVEVDLIVDGWARATARGEGKVTLRLPADAPLGHAFVVHVARAPFPQSRGVWLIGRIGAPRIGESKIGVWAAKLVAAYGAKDDPLAERLLGAPLTAEVEKKAVSALLRRLVPKRLRAPRRGPTSEAQLAYQARNRRAGIRQWRLPFRFFALLFAIVTALLARRYASSADRAERLVDEEAEDSGLAGLAADEASASSTGRTPRSPGGGWAIRFWGMAGLLAALCLMGLLDWVLG